MPKAKKKEKQTPEVKAPTRRYSVRLKNAPPDTVIIGGRKINDRQIIELPRDQMYLNRLESDGYRYTLTEA